MDFIRTSTPPYTGQSGKPRTEPARGILGWFASLMRTRTPEYRTAPAPQTARATRPTEPAAPDAEDSA